MTETKKEVPKFRVTQAPGFATGLVMHEIGTEIEWVVPDDWDTKKNGKHFAAHGPSTTFDCLNDAAVKLMEEHKENVRKKNLPKPTADDDRFKKMEAMHIEMMSTMLEMQAENRRLREDAEDGKKGRKKE
jgi:hypothetical protein